MTPIETRFTALGTPISNWKTVEPPLDVFREINGTNYRVIDSNTLKVEFPNGTTKTLTYEAGEINTEFEDGFKTRVPGIKLYIRWRDE